MSKVFTENINELWFFSIHRPRAQYKLYYILACIKLINKLKKLTNK